MTPFFKQPVTLRDVARALGLSHTTVGLALKNHPRIPEARRAEIKAKAFAMGYHPNPAAAALSQHKRTATVPPRQAALAWINNWQDPGQLRALREFDLYWQGAAEEAERVGYHLEEFIVNDRMPFPRLEKILLTRDITGILIPPQGTIRIDWTSFHPEYFSIVCFGRTTTDLPTISVTAAQTTNAVDAVARINAKGYQRIGFVGADRMEWTMAGGFFLAQRRLPKKSRLSPLLWSKPDAALFKSWLKREKPDAILTDNPKLRSMLQKLGYRVPEDIGLAGIGLHDCNIDGGIDQNPREIGRVAVHTLISLVRSNERGLPSVSRDILVNGRWVDGRDLPMRAVDVT